MRAPAPKSELITKINVTPVIDVALVLVIILLVTAPMMSASDLPVDLPQARTREAEDQRNVSITIGDAGRMAVDDDDVTPEQLRLVLEERLARPGNDGVLVVVRADRGVPFRVIRRTLEDAKAAGARRLAIATRQSSEGQP